ncbi:hypothetical protein Dsin_028298 [Dipteronia sinensis]|uniref:DUF1985 domain-containing protein n=1 Tax=Dipteronia sinensis TaxID=43782 RepID=A0AAD9ZRK2_9ROSI|nr:hypothetical protein Dsin_028298 [Dipteronia sinensis]
MIIDWFRNLIPNNNNSDEDMVKLALILLLEMMLVGKDDRNGILYLALELVDDLDVFNKFPWGLFIYARTFNSLASCLVGRDDKLKYKFKEGVDALAKLKVERYSVYPVYASIHWRTIHGILITIQRHLLLKYLKKAFHIKEMSMSLFMS